MSAASHDTALRAQLVALLEGGQAHARFEDVLRDWPDALRGAKPAGAAHSPWQVLEHMRIAQRDILEFSRNPHYRAMNWPDDYWPAGQAPGSVEDWDRSIAQIRLDLDALKALIEDSDADLYAPFAWGEGQTLLREALLVADHNAYHLGEMMTLRRTLTAEADAS